MVIIKYNYEDVLKAVKISKSIANVLRLIGLKPKGGNYRTINKFISNHNIDITHFTGKAHNVGDAYTRVNEEIPIEFYLVNGLMISSDRLKKRLINKKIKEHRCEMCKLEEWFGDKIPLELHHVDGNHSNNELINIQLLCPNCHTNTPNYRGKNNTKNTTPKTLREMYPEFFIKKEKQKIIKDVVIKEKVENFCECGKKIHNSSKNCHTCKIINDRKVERPPYEELLKEIDDSNYCAVGRKYSVSDNAIRKWVKSYEKLQS